MRVYISGPITGHDDYLEKFEEAEMHLFDKGYGVVNPAALNAVMPHNATHEEYMNICMELIDMYDAIYMLDGWQQSTGANREYGYALAKGMMVINSLEGL